MPSCTLLNMCMIYDPATDRVLVQDKIHPRWPGITFPGGHVDCAESIYASTIREVKEETGLEVSSLEPVGLIHMENAERQERRIIFLYRTTRFHGELISESHEGKVFWVGLQELEGLRLSPNMREYLRVFLDEDVLEAYVTRGDDWKSVFAYLPG